METHAYGTPEEVREAIKKINGVLEQISTANKGVDNMLQQLSTTSKDRSYNTAETIVEEVKAIVEGCREPVEEVENQLTDYAVFLEVIRNG